MQFRKIIALLIVFSIIPWVSYTQEAGEPEIVKAVTLDSVMVLAVKKGFDINDFINMVKNDTTFYGAFKSLRYHPYTANSKISVMDRKGKMKATYSSEMIQQVENNCRWMDIRNEQMSGRFLKRNGENKYYTAKLFFYLFYTPDTICWVNENATETPLKEMNTIEKHKQQLKTLIFNPGTPVEGIPVIKNKLAIFEPKMVQFYHYAISSVLYNDTIPCYLFKVEKKNDLTSSKDNKVVIKELTTLFNKKTFEIIKRAYKLSYSTMLFDFDVNMDVQLQKAGDILIVKRINYNGNWDILLQKPEVVDFEIQFYGF